MNAQRLLFSFLMHIPLIGCATESYSNKTQVSQIIEKARFVDGKNKQLSLFKQVLDTEPNNLRALYNAAVLSTDSQPNDAIEYYERLLKLDANDCHARINVVNLYIQEAKINSAFHVRWHINWLKYILSENETIDTNCPINISRYDNILAKASNQIARQYKDYPLDELYPYTQISNLLEPLPILSESRGTSGFDAERKEFRILFSEESDTLDSIAKKQLKEFVCAFAEGLLENKIFLLRGHANVNEGDSPQEKELLGVKRASEVKDYIVNKYAFKPSRIIIESAGDRWSGEAKSRSDSSWRAGVSVHYAGDGNAPVLSNLNKLISVEPCR